MHWFGRVFGRHLSEGDSEGPGELLRARLGAAEARLGVRLREARRELDGHLEALDTTSAALVFPRVLDLAEAQRVLRELGGLTADGAPPVYVVSTLFLRDAFAYLTRDRAEDMAYVTGSEWDGGQMLERMVHFEKAHRSAIRVEGDPESSHRALIGLTEQGHRLLAWLHSHPGEGEIATLPSGIDLGHQERLERGGYPAVGAIFSRDGYLRFFSKEFPFRVHLHGKGVRKINGRLYQVEVG